MGHKEIDLSFLQLQEQGAQAVENTAKTLGIFWNALPETMPDDIKGELTMLYTATMLSASVGASIQDILSNLDMSGFDE